MKGIVTGGLGFIGSNLVKYLLSKYEDIEILNIDKIGIGANLKNLKDVESDERYRFISGDISDTNLISEVIKEVDVVINVAAETHVDRSISDPALFFQSNTMGTFTLLEALRKLNDRAKMIHVGTDEVYGDIIKGSFSEIDALNPSNPYSGSKAAADMFCLSYYRTYGLDIIITRCTNNFGPYQFPEKFIPKTIIRALKNLPIPVYGTGENVREWIYVLDHCEALDLILGKGRIGEIYNISAGNELSNIQLVKEILRIMDKPESLITFVEDRPGHDVRYSLDSTKIRTKLGWKPIYPFSVALKNSIEWYISNEQWWLPLINEKVVHMTPWKIKW